MAKILCITSGLTGILNASFELGKRVEKAGHEFIYASPKPVEEKVTLNGFNYHQLPEIHQHPGPKIPHKNKVRRLAYKWANRKHIQKEALNRLIPFDYSQLIEEVAPDLVIIDIELHEYIMHTHQKNIPFVILSQWFTLWRADGLPYLTHDTIPGIGMKGKKWMLHLSWNLIIMKRKWIFLKKKMMSAGTDRRSTLIRFAKEIDFPIDFIKENYWPGPFSYSDLPVWGMAMKELEFPHQQRENLTYIGPMVNEDRVEAPLNQNDKVRLKDALNQKHHYKKKLVYCSMSTMHNSDSRFLLQLIAAVREVNDWVVIISLAGDQAIPSDLPDHIYVFSYLPQLEVLKEADLAVHHGGIHTIHECIHFQVPMVSYSGKQADQSGCSARIQFHGIGLMGDRDSDQADDILKKLQEVMSNKRYREKIAAVYRDYQKYKTKAILEKQIAQMTWKKKHA